MTRHVPFLCAIALVAACGFPGVSYDDDGGAPDATADTAAGDDGRSPDGSSSGGDVGSPGDAADASADVKTSVDGARDAPGDQQSHDVGVDGPPRDANGDSPDCIDVDGDGYYAVGSCGGTDCCDTDSNAHPGQTSFFTTADACDKFDYNCDGAETPEFATDFTCSGLGTTGCSGGPGFIGHPSCGGTGPWGTCEGTGAGMLGPCAPTGDSMTVTEGCN